MNFDTVMKLIGRWAGTIRFFPSEPEARFGIAESISGMAADEDQVRWLVGRLPQLYTDWPGMLEVRAVFCTKFKPRDGIEAALGTESPAFAALCPEDEERKALEAAPRSHQLTGQIAKASADPEMAALIERCKKPLSPLAGVKAASQSEIDRIKAEQDRNRKESVGSGEARRSA